MGGIDSLKICFRELDGVVDLERVARRGIEEPVDARGHVGVEPAAGGVAAARQTGRCQADEAELRQEIDSPYIIGVPLTAGFISKWYLLSGVLANAYYLDVGIARFVSGPITAAAPSNAAAAARPARPRGRTA